VNRQIIFGRPSNPTCLMIMLLRFIALVFLCFGHLCPSVSQAQAPESADRARVYVDSVRAALDIPGMSVAVARGGQIVWSEGFGFANLEHDVPVTTQTRFRIGSVSKPIAAAAVALLHEEGLLDLDRPVGDYVPAFPKKRWDFSTRQLTGHLAGIRHYEMTEDNWITRRYFDTLSALDVFAEDSLLHQPGSKYHYSTHAWTLISAVVEAASGEAFVPYMQRNVFDRLNLQSIMPEYMDSLIAGRTSYYLLDDRGRLVNAPFVDNSWKWAGGGFVSNTEDLVRFGVAHLRDGFLQSSTRELLFTSQRITTGEETNYGIGWSVTSLDGRRVVGHSGGSVGGTAMLLLVPDADLVVSVLSNRSGAPSQDIARMVATLFLPPSD
jgi:serine beta-lactamase-like protein LACTB, mitochondrial